MSPQRAERCFSTDYPDTSSRLMNIGKIIAGDLFINNPDRFPLVWDNDGNETNLLFEVKNDEKVDDELLKNPTYTSFTFTDAVAIDQRCFCIS